MALTEVDKAAVRRHLNYSAIGLYRQSPVGGTLAPVNTGFRFFTGYAQLEYRMNNFLPNEESIITGRPYGAIGFVNANPINPSVPVQPGSTIQITLNCAAFSANPVVLNYTVVSGDTLLSICGQLALQAASNGVFTSAGFYAMNDYGAGPYGQPNNPSQIVSFPIVSFVSPDPAITFTIAVSGTGNTIPQIVNQGVPIPPSLTSHLTVPSTKIYGYIPICNYLEDLWAGSSSDNLDTYKANDAVLRTNELEKREKQYRQWANRLAEFIGVASNPDNPGTHHPYGGNSSWSCI